MAPTSRKAFGGIIGKTFEDSTPSWPDLDVAAPGSPNIVVVLLDDVGFAQFGCYGSDIRTPTFDALAAAGLRYSNFHTTALCSPTRAALLTGRNHHTVGMGRVAEIASGFPGYNAEMSHNDGMISEILVRNGYSTFAVGKWHLTPAHEAQMGASRWRWPLGRGFERFYGFLGGETDQYHPDLVYDNHEVDPPKTPDEGYHFTEDMADKAITFMNDARAAHQTKPFFLWFAPGACHAPHQAPKPFIDAYRDQFNQGWDTWREEVFARQLAAGVMPAGTTLSERPHWVPAWDSLSADERRLYSRMMEVYAGFLTHTDAQVGRLVEHVKSLGEFDNTIFVVMSDNGASAEGGPKGSYNEVFFFNFVPESLEENLKRIDLLGTPKAHNHYPWGWAWAGNTPFKRWKRETHEGGVTDPLIVHWPQGIKQGGGVRHQYTHAVDLMPTLLDLLQIAPPAEIAGVSQSPIEGVSFAHTLNQPDVATKHLTQYFEMMGSRALYHDGWKAVVFHPMMGFAYDGSDASLPFDRDEWELYNIDNDRAEIHNLAETHPEKLQEMIALWWREAEAHRVLPLNNQPGKFGDRRHRRERYEYRPGIGSLPRAVAPNLHNRGFRIIAEVNSPGEVSGAICAHGSASAGYAVYVRDNRLHYVHNFLGLQRFVAAASVPIPRGAHRLVVEFTMTARFKGNVELFYDDLPVGAAEIPMTVPFFYGTAGFTVGYLRGHSVIHEEHVPFAFTDGALHRVIIEPESRTWRDPVLDPKNADRAALGTQ
ncbi:MAG: arylsulfatase [Ilumatobacteraceae bacterium]|nr:arylsulfatase [Ilumatobacteraceae bacterium]